MKYPVKCALLVLCLSSLSHAEDWIYKTQPGDNLWNITERHLVDINHWSDLKRINKLADPDNITPGTLLRIPIEWLHHKPSQATLLYAIGNVKLIDSQGKSLSPITDNMMLSENTRLITQEDGLVSLLFTDGSRLLLQSNSELVLEGLHRYGDGTLTDTHLKLEQGRVENQVTHLPAGDAHYKIRTSLATTTVRGTDFRVSAGSATEPTLAEVLQGKVMVGAPHAKKDIQLIHGEGAVIRQGDTHLTAVKLPSPPDASQLPVLIERTPIQVPMAEKVEIGGYHTQVALQSNPTKILSERQSKNNVLYGGDLPDGQYIMKVRAISPDGLEGLETTHTFTLNAQPEPPFTLAPKPNQAVLEAKPTFTWGEVSSARSYQFQLAKDDAFKDVIFSALDLTKATVVADQELPEGQYFWRVAIIDKAGEQGPFGDPQRFRRPPNAPGLEEAKLDDKTLILNWRNAGEGVRYRVQIANDRQFENIYSARILTSNAYEMPKPKPGEYFLRIQIIDAENVEGKWSPPQRFTVPSGEFKLVTLLPLLLLL